MKRLFIDGTEMDIDNKTVIALNDEAFDIANPSIRKVRTSNNLSLPPTSKNMAVIGVNSIRGGFLSSAYEKKYCDYYSSGLKLIDKGRVFIDSVDERINIVLSQKKDIWDRLKETKWPDVKHHLIQWLNIPEIQFDKTLSQMAGDFRVYDDSAVDFWAAGVFLPMAYGTRNDFVPASNFENIGKIFTNWAGESVGHFFLRYKKFFQFLEYWFGVDFNTDIGIFQDEIVKNTGIRISELVPNGVTKFDYYSGYISSASPVYESTYPTVPFNYHMVEFDITSGSGTVDIEIEMDCIKDYDASVEGRPHETVIIKRNSVRHGVHRIILNEKGTTAIFSVKYKATYASGTNPILLNISNYNRTPTIDVWVLGSVYGNNESMDDIYMSDLVTSFMNVFNLIPEYLEDGSIKLNKFGTGGNVDWSGNIEKISRIEPKIDGLSQYNDIIWSNVPENFSEKYAGVLISCKNQNIKVNDTLFEIKGYVPALRSGSFDLQPSDSVKMPVVMTYGGSQLPVNVVHYTYRTYDLLLYNSMIYDFSSEYTNYAAMIFEPEKYTIKKWLTPMEFFNFQYNRRYFIKELGGFFFVNKISGFNEDAKEATQIELIRLK